MESLKIAALGRRVLLGDLYNCETGDFANVGPDRYLPNLKLSRWIDAQQRAVQISFMVQTSDADLHFFLGLNAATKRGLTRNNFWFNDLCAEQCPQDKVRVIVRLERCVSTEVLEVDNIRTSVGSVRSICGISRDICYIVRQITYGAQATVVLQMDVTDQSQRQRTQDELLLASVSFFNQLTCLNKRPEALDQVTCCFYSDVMAKSALWIPFTDCVNQYVHPFVFNNDVKWVPQDLLLCPISKTSSIRSDQDLHNELDYNANVLIKAIRSACDQVGLIIKEVGNGSVPHLTEHLTVFKNSLTTLSSSAQSIRSSSSSMKLSTGTSHNFISSACRHYLTNAAFDRWLSAKRREVDALKRLLSGVNVQMISADHLQPGSNLRVFQLSTMCGPDPLIEEIKWRTGKVPKPEQFRLYRIGWESDEYFVHVKSKLLLFELKSKKGRQPSFLTTSDSYQDEAVTVKFGRTTLNNLNSVARDTRSTANQSLMSPRVAGVPTVSLVSPVKQPVDVGSRRSVTSSVSADSTRNYNGPRDSGEQFNQSTVMGSSVLDVSASDSAATGDSYNAKTEEVNVSANVSSSMVNTKTQSYSSIQQGNPDHRLAESYVRSSQMIQNGQPSVHFLECAQRVSKSMPLRWFHLGRPDSSVPHKTILLTGGTGSGKSTLVDAMVNYVLGVRWEDPFRFTIVPDEGGRSQAHSQTRYVTSYTLHHVTGMAVPYSLTIIDTPGFGDTGGVKRDEEITQMICQLLMQTEDNIRDINAICFVASSADARLTATQRYIISSVLSLFGKDVMGHIRLLATFSDGARPPVVEACRQAGFPLAQDGTGFYKFNNSVLLTSNDDQAAFDHIFWIMAQKSFANFFAMLTQIPAKSLALTKKVVQNRVDQESKLLFIEQLLDECCKSDHHIRTADKNYREMKEEIERKRASKQLNYDKFIVRKQHVGYSAYNCYECRKTCSRSIVPVGHCSCGCPRQSHRAEKVVLSTDRRTVRYKYSEQMEKDEAKCQSYLAENSKLERDFHDKKAKIVDLLQELSKGGRR